MKNRRKSSLSPRLLQGGWRDCKVGLMTLSLPLRLIQSLSPPPFKTISTSPPLLKPRGPCSMRKISKGGCSSKYATAQSAITKGSPLLHFFWEGRLFVTSQGEKKAGRKCALKGRKDEEEEEEEIMTAVRPLFPARVGGRSDQAREERRKRMETNHKFQKCQS